MSALSLPCVGDESAGNRQTDTVTAEQQERERAREKREREEERRKRWLRERDEEKERERKREEERAREREAEKRVVEEEGERERKKRLGHLEVEEGKESGEDDGRSVGITESRDQPQKSHDPSEESHAHVNKSPVESHDTTDDIIQSQQSLDLHDGSEGHEEL